MKALFLFISLFLLCGTLVAQLKMDIMQQKISGSDLELICDDELSLLRNEIYARHGYRFGIPYLKQHFETIAWYTPAVSNRNIRLNSIEKYNASFILREERKREEKKKSITHFIHRTSRLLKKDENIFSNQYIFNHIKPDSIYYCGSHGRYTFTKEGIEGERSPIDYFITIKENEIRIGYEYELIEPIERKTLEDGSIESIQMISPEGKTDIYTIDENNNITYSYSSM